MVKDIQNGIRGVRAFVAAHRPALVVLLLMSAVYFFSYFQRVAIPGTVFVDIPPDPIGSPTFPLDVTAAISSDKKKLVISVANPTEEKQEFTPQINGVTLRGPGKLFQIAPPSLTSSNQVGQKPVVEIVEQPQPAFTGAVQVPPISVNVYEFEIA